MAEAQGRDVGSEEGGGGVGGGSGNEVPKKHHYITEILKWRAQSSPDQILFTLLNNKNHVAGTLNALQLHKKAEKFALVATENGKLNWGDHVALLYPPGLDLIAAVYACFYVGLIPVPIRPPNPNNMLTTLPTVKMIVQVSKSVAVLTNGLLIKLLRSKDASQIVDSKFWPPMINTDDSVRRKTSVKFRIPPTPEMLAYLDFSVSTTGMLAGVKVCCSSLPNRQNK